jgi:glycosyltransferase involved in cell wall biosynthesis
MTRILTISLVTLGDPGRLTGGYRYHRRMAELAPSCAAAIRFVSFPERPFPLPALAGRAVLRQALAPRSSTRGARRRRILSPQAVEARHRYLTAAPADVVVLDSIAAAFLAPWLPRRPPVPVVGSLHQPPGGIDHGPPRRGVQAALDRMAYRRARLLLVASAALGEELAAAGFRRERIRVVPPGRDLPTTGPAAAPRRGDLRRGRRAGLLCVANWVPRKGLLELLEATARLPDGLATLHLAGDDRADRRYGDRVRERLARPDLAGRVVVHGPLPAERVAALYQEADVFVLPSLREPYGTVWGEAMAAGLPVAGWRAGNLPHLADDGREGLLADPGDVPALRDALARLAADEDLRRGMGAAAARRAADRPTWAQSAALFFSALREAADGHDTGPA